MVPSPIAHLSSGRSRKRTKYKSKSGPGHHMWVVEWHDRRRGRHTVASTRRRCWSRSPVRPFAFAWPKGITTWTRGGLKRGCGAVGCPLNYCHDLLAGEDEDDDDDEGGPSEMRPSGVPKNRSCSSRRLESQISVWRWKGQAPSNCVNISGNNV